MIKFQRIRQETGSYCGPAVFAMLVSAFGLSLRQEDMVEACEAQNTVMKVGIPLEDLAKGLKKIYPDLVVWQKLGSTVDEIKALGDKGYLVAVDWQGVFAEDEYGDDEEDKWGDLLNKVIKAPEMKGTQGHYCIVLEVNQKKGFIKFVDPYGHYAGQDRFIAIWEFLERWWDDKLIKVGKLKKQYVVEDRLMFLIAKKGDNQPKKLGMKRV